jgi:hypothetical protein
VYQVGKKMKQKKWESLSKNQLHKPSKNLRFLAELQNHRFWFV